MNKPDYTKLDYFGEVICPHCGAILKCKDKIEEHSCFGEDLDYTHYETVRCPNCKISGSSLPYNFESPNAWKIPKDVPVTITEAQSKYIKYLASHFSILRVPYFINKEVAATWIAQYVNLLVEETRFDLYIQVIEKHLKAQGYPVQYTENYCGVCPKYLEFQKKYFHEDGNISSYAILYIHFLVDKRDFVFSLTTSPMSIESKEVQTIANDFLNLPLVLADLKDTLLTRPLYPPKEVARKYLEEHKGFTPRFSISFITHETPKERATSIPFPEEAEVMIGRRAEAGALDEYIPDNVDFDRNQVDYEDEQDTESIF